VAHKNYRRRNPVAKEVRQNAEYRQRIVPDIKKYDRPKARRTAFEREDYWWGDEENAP